MGEGWTLVWVYQHEAVQAVLTEGSGSRFQFVEAEVRLVDGRSFAANVHPLPTQRNYRVV